jgi:hypothetical protein
MIAAQRNSRAPDVRPLWHQHFLAILPQVRKQAYFAFRRTRLEAKEELVAEVIANVYCAIARLAERNKLDTAYPTTLAHYAIRQVRCGRLIATKSNSDDVSSRRAQLANRIVLDRLDRFDSATGVWREQLVEDRQAGPADTAAARIDVSAWLMSLTHRHRTVAIALARGEATAAVAEICAITPGRVSQLRNELRQSWNLFQRTATA